MANVKLTVIGLFIVGIFVTIVGCGTNAPHPEISEFVGYTDYEVELGKNFPKIKPMMTEEQVLKILGKPEKKWTIPAGGLRKGSHYEDFGYDKDLPVEIWSYALNAKVGFQQPPGYPHKLVTIKLMG